MLLNLLSRFVFVSESRTRKLKKEKEKKFSVPANTMSDGKLFQLFMNNSVMLVVVFQWCFLFVCLFFEEGGKGAY